jgi:hypothetical protein
MDVAIPIVFPDYLIAVNTPPAQVQIPDLLPGIDILPPMIRIPGSNQRVPELGHAGVFFFNVQGVTKYYEYGRYDRAARGLTRRTPIHDVVIAEGGRPTAPSLRNALALVSARAGQRGRIMGAYIDLAAGGYKRMLRFCQARVAENGDPSRQAYDLLSRSCIHFVKDAVEAGGVDAPWMISPRPIDYIERVRDDYPNLDYIPSDNRLAVEGIALHDPHAVRTGTGTHR